jgi:hypothetical protein
MLPVYRGQLQARCLGMAVAAWNEQGNSSQDPLILLSNPSPPSPK